jgi:hypothetical protein
MRGRGLPDGHNTRQRSRRAPRPCCVELGGHVLEMLGVALEGAGFAVVSAKLSEIQSGVMDLVAFVKEHRPVGIVYDLPRPYEANWNFPRLLRRPSS